MNQIPDEGGAPRLPSHRMRRFEMDHRPEDGANATKLLGKDVTDHCDLGVGRDF